MRTARRDFGVGAASIGAGKPEGLRVFCFFVSSYGLADPAVSVGSIESCGTNLIGASRWSRA